MPFTESASARPLPRSDAQTSSSHASPTPSTAERVASSSETPPPSPKIVSLPTVAPALASSGWTQRRGLDTGHAGDANAQARSEQNDAGGQPAAPGAAWREGEGRRSSDGGARGAPGGTQEEPVRRGVPAAPNTGSSSPLSPPSTTALPREEAAAADGGGGPTLVTFATSRHAAPTEAEDAAALGPAVASANAWGPSCATSSTTFSASSATAASSLSAPRRAQVSGSPTQTPVLPPPLPPRSPHGRAAAVGGGAGAVVPVPLSAVFPSGAARAGSPRMGSSPPLHRSPESFTFAGVSVSTLSDATGSGAGARLRLPPPALRYAEDRGEESTARVPALAGSPDSPATAAAAAAAAAKGLLPDELASADPLGCSDGDDSDGEAERAYICQLQSLQAEKTRLECDVTLRAAPAEMEAARLATERESLGAAQRALADAVTAAVEQQTAKTAELHRCRAQYKIALQEREHSRAFWRNNERRQRAIDERRAVAEDQLRTLQSHIQALRCSPLVSLSPSPLASPWTSSDGAWPTARPGGLAPARTRDEVHRLECQQAARAHTLEQLRLQLADERAALALWQSTLTELRAAESESKRDSTAQREPLLEHITEEPRPAAWSLQTAKEEHRRLEAQLQRLSAGQKALREIMAARRVLGTLKEAKDGAARAARYGLDSLQRAKALASELRTRRRTEEATLKTMEDHYVSTLSFLRKFAQS